MRYTQAITQKIMPLAAVKAMRMGWKMRNKYVAFTNGCFDILHEGHIASLSKAAEEADYLIVGVNSDASTKRLKGPERPINHEHSRALILASLLIVDAVVIFEEDTPLELIKVLEPDVLVKGGDYTIDTIVGAKEVLANNGRVVINPIIEGFSTTSILQKIRQLG
ncbi:MAG: D-glycero-beta-D-manno-heptose 1-phosphate adenylyltransferase [Bacteroidota bacterium]|jgi:D-beta-D-heptose 7-phosphate kinase/D-beta-D-heptose 1-phosphate adenosyltransferase|nr:D-glycero-beta-D-manno-heptose 1-phosphate adenylyltransferase [Bacteroidota bacterium]